MFLTRVVAAGFVVVSRVSRSAAATMQSGDKDFSRMHHLRLSKLANLTTTLK